MIHVSFHAEVPFGVYVNWLPFTLQIHFDHCDCTVAVKLVLPQFHSIALEAVFQFGTVAGELQTLFDHMKLFAVGLELFTVIVAVWVVIILFAFLIFPVKV